MQTGCLLARKFSHPAVAQVQVWHGVGGPCRALAGGGATGMTRAGPDTKSGEGSVPSEIELLGIAV